MIKDWININSIEDFKKVGNFTYVRRLIKEDLNEFNKNNGNSEIDILKVLHITSNSIEGLIEKIKLLKTFAEKILINIDNIKDNKCDSNKYFKSDKHEIIFYLNELDGEERLNKLSVYKAHYLNETLARKWYLDIAKKIHPDTLVKDKIDGSEEAMSKLIAIYNGMKNNEK